MKEFFFLIFAGILIGCTSPAAQLYEETDLKLKDSIARADGDKVLGNIKFGVSQDEFMDQQIDFLKAQNDSIYGYYIQEIEGAFTPTGQLYEVKFVGIDCDNHNWKEVPFRDFLTDKFGEESVPHNKWIVGNRVISILRERRFKSLNYTLKNKKWPVSPDDPDIRNQYNFYLMRFTSDSLRRDIERQTLERKNQLEWSQKQEQQERLMQQQKKNEADVRSL